MGSKSSTSKDPLNSRTSTVVVGRILRPHGVRGEVLVEVLSDTPERFAPGSRMLLVRGEERRPVEIEGCRGHNRGALVRISGLGDREKAGELNGATLEVEASRVPPAEEGTFYHFELVGCRCRDRRLGDLGEVVDLLEDGGGLLLIARGGDREVPIPFVRSFLVEMDRERREIELDLPEGLVEICAFKS